MSSEAPYLPALRFRALTRFYDPLIRATTRESTFRRRLLDQAGLAPGQRVLDLGCGTGTLALLALAEQPAAELTGLDADPEMIARARAKAEDAGAEARFDEGRSDRLPYADGSFDRVLSTLFFHHLDPEPKRRTAAEIARVLAPGGELHVADWGRPADPLMAVAFLGVRVLDGFENTRSSARGELPRLFEDAGLLDAAETGRMRTVFGTLSLYRARR